MGNRIPPALVAQADTFVALRRDLHRHPELGFEELRTSALVAEKLSEWGYAVTRGLGGTGVVGQLRRGTGQRRLGLRADMDALPIRETTGLPYASRHDGKMHACGHDGHTATLLAAARVLAGRKDQLQGTLHLIFQPAEEGHGGAQKMVEQGLFELFPCDALYAFHNEPGYPAGQFGFRAGVMYSSSDTAIITIRGKGSHDHCRAGTQIQRTQRGGIQLFHTLNNGDLAIDLDVSTHTDQLVHIAEAVFPDAFRYNGSAIGQRQ